MNKADFIKAVSNRTSLTQIQAKEALNAILEEISDSLANGEEVTFVNFGTFKVAERQEREGRNPKTGEKMIIKYAKLPKFNPGKLLREAVDN